MENERSKTGVVSIFCFTLIDPFWSFVYKDVSYIDERTGAKGIADI